MKMGTILRQNKDIPEGSADHLIAVAVFSPGSCLKLGKIFSDKEETNGYDRCALDTYTTPTKC